MYISTVKSSTLPLPLVQETGKQRANDNRPGYFLSRHSPQLCLLPPAVVIFRKYKVEERESLSGSHPSYKMWSSSPYTLGTLSRRGHIRSLGFNASD